MRAPQLTMQVMGERALYAEPCDEPQHGITQRFTMQALLQRQSDFRELCIHSTRRAVDPNKLVKPADLGFQIPAQLIGDQKELLLHRILQDFL